MPSGKVPSFTDYAGGQSPDDVIYICKTPFGVTDDRFNTLDDTFDIITKNVTNLSIQWADGAAVSTLSSASAGRLRYSQSAVSAAGSFQVSENAAAFQNLIKGPTSAGNLTANLLPFATAGDVIGDTAWCQLGATTSRTSNFNPHNPGTSLASYGAAQVGVVSQASTNMFGMYGLRPSITGTFFGGSVASPTAATANTVIFTLTARGQYNTTPGNISAGTTITCTATENWSASLSGSSLGFTTSKQGVAPGNDITRLLLNQLGCVHVAPTVTNGQSTSGTLELFRVGGSGYVTDNLALSFFADTTTGGGTTVKNLVAQQKGSQTGALLETQSATGVAQFGLYPLAGTVNHIIDWAGSVNTPSVSAAASAKLFISGDGVLLASQGQSGYGVVMGRQNNVQITDYAVKIGDTGAFISNIGALGTAIYTLPAIPNQSATGNSGIVFTFYARTNQVIVLQLPTGTLLRDIGGAATSAAGTATSTAQYDLIKVIGTRDANGANPEYIVEIRQGTFTLA